MQTATEEVMQWNQITEKNMLIPCEQLLKPQMEGLLLQGERDPMDNQWTHDIVNNFSAFMVSKSPETAINYFSFFF